MTISFRLTIFYSILLTLVLIATGIGVHFLLKKSLENNLDQTMIETAKIILSSFEYEEDDEEPHFDNENIASDMAIVVLDKKDRILTNSSKFSDLEIKYPKLLKGFYWLEAKRVYVQNIADNRILLIHDRVLIDQALAQFDTIYKTIIPIIALLSFFLGSILAKQALKPVAKLTNSAYALAENQAWQKDLPEPQTKDELWRLTRAFNALLKTLRSLIETEKRFTADASHELRTPLTVIQGRLEQVLENPDDSKNLQRLKKAQQKTLELSGLVENLLDLARAESGQGLKKQALALDELVFHIAEELKVLFKAKNLELVAILPKTPIYIYADRQAIAQIIRNLLENSLKFSETGRVEIIVQKENQKVDLKVIDSGIGIPEEDIDKIFERFYQTDVRHRQKGSGLGLAIVKTIADWHAAEVSVKNRPNSGIEVKLVFDIFEDNKT